jgi:hypothetical protein
MVMDRALVVVLVKAVALEAASDLVLARAEATEEGMVQPTMLLMGVLTT